MKHSAEDIKEPLSPESVPAQKQLKYTPGIANGQVRESAAFMDQNRRVIRYSPLILIGIYLSIGLRMRHSINADGTHWATVNEKASNCWTNFWQAMEVEKKPPSMANTIQMEVAEAVETF